ncbi:MAG: RrF2 family transcriptional regulator [Rubripirellula sp.]
MLISARAHYASLALLELASRSASGDLVTIREISDRHAVPGPFLVQILRTLRAAGWVQSIRGSQGGYRLAVDPTQLSLLDIVEAVGCQEGAGPRAEGKATAADQLLQGIWDEALEASRRVLAEAHLSDLVEQSKHGDSTMFYI